MKLFLTFCLVIVIHFSLFAQYEDSGKRGIYFTKKMHTASSIPTFEAKKDELPAPIIEDRADYIELYWKAWELAFNHYKRPLDNSPFVSNYIDEAFAPNIFQWDTIFMIMFVRYAHFIFPAIESLDNFYCRQYENGYICREIVEATGEDFVFEGREHTVNPPLFSWCEIENYRISGDKSRFRDVLPVLEKYADWLEKHRKKENTKHGLFWQTGLGSGMDNTPRSGSGWVDISSQMVLLYSNMAVMYGELNEPDKSEICKEKAELISNMINKFMWNEEEGLYYDIDDDGKQVKCKTIACFWPMLAGISSDDQVKKMLANLKDPNSFWRQIPFPSLAADHKDYKPDGQYWLGSVWAPTNVAVIKGLNNYPEVENTTEFATAAVEKYLDGMYEVYKKTGTIWENYSPEFNMRGLFSKPDFVGWSGCGPIQLLIENILGFRPDGPNEKLTWYLYRVDRHGIEKLRFGSVTASLVSERRANIYCSVEITIESNHSFELLVVLPDRVKTINVTKGKNSYTID
jgi:glycogen debranching enzyme